MKRIAAAIVLLIGSATMTTAHGLHHEVRLGEAIVVELTQEGGTPLADADVEIRAVGDDVAYLTGRTDAYGRVSFVPDREGSWTCRARSADGHGVEFTFDAAEIVAATAGHDHRALARLAPPLLGVALIVLLFAGLRAWTICRSLTRRER